MQKLLKEKEVVQPRGEHIHVPKGDKAMNDDQNGKEFKFGNATVIVYSPLVNMTSEERKVLYEEEWAKGNQTLKEIVACVKDCIYER